MKTRLYSIYDKKIKNGSLPFFSINDAEATRTTAHLVNHGEGSSIYDYPEDFSLIYLGTFDDLTLQFDQTYETVVDNCYDLYIPKKEVE